MDYKYIEQLIERYFQCETTLQEEHILCTFFAQDEQEVPEQLRQYQPLFAAMQPEDVLSEDFDQRILALTEEPHTVKARTISLSQRLRPLFRAAAVVAIVLTLGNAMNITFRQDRTQADDINYAAYKDTYEDPAIAYDQMENALQLISEGFSHAQRADSLTSDSLHSEVR
jgi:anti-sigma-K factor RskA